MNIAAFVARSIVSAATRRLRPAERAISCGTIKQDLSSAVMRSVARQLSALSAVTRPEDADDGSLGYSGTEDSDYVQPGGAGGAAMDSDAESDDEGSH